MLKYGKTGMDIMVDNHKATMIKDIYCTIPHHIENVDHKTLPEPQCQWLVVMGMYDTLNILLGETVTYGVQKYI